MELLLMARDPVCWLSAVPAPLLVVAPMA